MAVLARAIEDDADRQPAAGGAFALRPLPGAVFGGEVVLRGGGDTRAFVAAAEAEPDALSRALDRARGLLLLRGMDAISAAPELLVRLSRLFGPEVEDYRRTLTKQTSVHQQVPEIFIVSNMPPASRPPPPLPDPPLTADGRLPVQFPQRRGWHTDQSYRRPPPDISLFYAVIPAPKGQGQTMFASGVDAYAALPDAMKARLEGLEGLHVMPRSGRSEEAVRRGETPMPLRAHERPQRQPVVRVHPVTGTRALYLCESGQMDWVEGPLVGMQPGPDGDGAALLYELMTHLTRPEFVYVHEWDAGDIVVWDNRSLAHTATWFDADVHPRLMWRTTVRGNPGKEYDGERRSWIPEPDGEGPAATR
ncbi:MAG: TauD/TfdA family dioxygenase [Alphaproteobacteria bacterium]|nr:TauD/TfdA family dioxygenase [Alphaproteobacteria bacterium]